MPAPAKIAVSSVIRSFYRALLLREPDEAGLRAYVDAITGGSMTLEESLATFLASNEFRHVAKRLLPRLAGSDYARFTNDHSQYGELGMLLKHWINEAARHRIVVDVGARGRIGSNSYDLLKEFGWRGLLIEANPALIDPIHAEFSGLDYELLNVAVSDYDGRATLHIGVNDDVSSLDAEASLGWGAIRGTVSVDVKRLGPLLQDRGIPPDFDLLSLDIEGEDVKVLNDLIGDDYYRPAWIIIEASYDYQTESLDDLQLTAAAKSSYRIVGKTPANLILRRTPE